MATPETCFEQSLAIARTARDASRCLALAPRDQKDMALHVMTHPLAVHRKAILAANQEDMETAVSGGLTQSMVARLRFGEQQLLARQRSLQKIADLPDPVGQTIRQETRPSGLSVSRVRVPLGVILMVYEARPHVTVNAGAFCLKSGNASILRGGSEATRCNTLLGRLWRESLVTAGLPKAAIQVVSGTHEQVRDLLELPEHIDLVIPRGGKGLIRSVAEHSKIPVIKHYAGICHVEFIKGFRSAITSCEFSQRRVGAELKFPLVNTDGAAVSLKIVRALWRYLVGNGWEVIEDPVIGQIAGAQIAGPCNNTVASCETGYCKTEFSLAHVANLFELSESIQRLRKELAPFAREHDVRFLGYGIQPLTPPSRALLFRKARSCFWEQAFPSNQRIPQEQGDDVHLFTVNAGSHVHISSDPVTAVQAVNVLNGFAGAQIALTAHSPVWEGRRDPRYLCVNEKLWDWWTPASGRVGIPGRPFRDLEDYVAVIEKLAPIYANRNGQPILLPGFDTFRDYFSSTGATGKSLQGEVISVVPKPADIHLHNSCYWYTARISQYFTVENRVFDQQPPDELESVAALTLGLVSAAAAAWEELSRYSWKSLREAREVACCEGLAGWTEEFSLAELVGRMLRVADYGLSLRRLGEEVYLKPLRWLCSSSAGCFPQSGRRHWNSRRPRCAVQFMSTQPYVSWLPRSSGCSCPNLRTRKYQCRPRHAKAGTLFTC